MRNMVIWLFKFERIMVIYDIFYIYIYVCNKKVYGIWI